MRFIMTLGVILVALFGAAPVSAAVLSPTYTVSIQVVKFDHKPLVIAFDLIGGGDFSLFNRVDVKNVQADGRRLEDITLFGGSAFFSQLITLPELQELTFEFSATTDSLPPIFGVPYVSDVFAVSALEVDTLTPLNATTDPTGANTLMAYELGYTSGGALLSVYAGEFSGTQISLTVVPVPLSSAFSFSLIGLLVTCSTLWRRHRAATLIICLSSSSLCAAAPEDVGTWVDVSRSGFVYNRTSRTMDQVVKVTPKARFELKGQAYIVVDSIEFKNKAPLFDSLDKMIVANPTTTIDGKTAVAKNLPNGVLKSGSTVSFTMKYQYFRNAIPQARPPASQFVVRARVFGEPRANADFYVAPGPPSASALDQLPANPDTGRRILFESGDNSFEYDPSMRTPITAAAACASWILGCFKPGQRSLDECAKFAPACQTSTPWLETTSCCPTQCAFDYAQTRQTGVPAEDAFLQTYVDTGTCLPGYPELIRATH